MKKFILTVLTIATLSYLSIATAMSNGRLIGGDDPGPFPWYLCEIPVNNMFGVWTVKDENSTPLYYIQISEINDGTIIVTKYKYSEDFKDSLSEILAQGEGSPSKDKMEFIAHMKSSSNKGPGSYLLYFESYCDDNGNQRYEIVETPLGGSAKGRSGDNMIRQKFAD